MSQTIGGMEFDEEDWREAVLREAAEGPKAKVIVDPKPKGYGKTTRPKNLLRKRKVAKGMTAQSKGKNRPKRLSRRKERKPLHRRKNK